jgi:hypothetical protein
MSKIITRKQLNIVVESTMKEVGLIKENDKIVLSKEQMDSLHKDGECKVNDTTIVYQDEMKEGDYMGDNMNENKKMCSECGTGMMVEGTCNECGYSMNMGEETEEVDSEVELEEETEEMEEGNEFTEKLADARKEGKPTFTIDGKTYKVEPVDKEEKDDVKESISELTESLYNTTNKEILKEEMDFFNKIINYNK